MTTKEKVKEIRLACIKAKGLEKSSWLIRKNLPLRLADVLLALSYNSMVNHHNKNDFNKLEYGVGTDSFWIGNSITHISMDWGLKNDSLDWHTEHIPDTIDFIYSLIKK